MANDVTIQDIRKSIESLKGVSTDYYRHRETINSRLPKTGDDFFITVEFADHDIIGSNVEFLPDGHYLIKVDRSQLKNQLKGCPAWMIIAHEIGHALAKQFDLPKTKEITANRKYWLTPDSEREVIAYENEAWDVAEEILRVRKHALGTYKQHYDKKRSEFWNEHLNKLRR